MKNLMKPVVIIGKVLGLVMGENFTTPISRTLQENPYLWFGA